LLDAAEGRYRALVTDINLSPGQLDGWDVAQHAREIDLHFPVVYVSGKDADDWASKGVPNSIMLAKPFTPAQLVTAVSQPLNASPASRVRLPVLPPCPKPGLNLGVSWFRRLINFDQTVPRDRCFCGHPLRKPATARRKPDRKRLPWLINAPPPPKETLLADEDGARTSQARRVIEDYANGLREIIRRLRKKLD
jgi:hypothetical protein